MTESNDPSTTSLKIMEQDNKKESWLNKQKMRWILIVYGLLWAGSGLFLWIFLGSSKAGSFGDMFGAFNAFISGLAMLGVIAAILLQKEQIEMQAEELRLQRKELKLQRKEIKKNRKEFERQAKAQEKQARALAFAGILSVTSASAEALGTRIRYLRGLLKKVERQAFVELTDEPGIRQEISELQRELEAEFVRIRELRQEAGEHLERLPRR